MNNSLQTCRQDCSRGVRYTQNVDLNSHNVTEIPILIVIILTSIVLLGCQEGRGVYTNSLNPPACGCGLDLILIFGVLTIFQLYHGDQFLWWRKPEYPERTTDHGQATGKHYHLRLRVECTLFCNLQSRARTHAILVIGLYELLDPTT